MKINRLKLKKLSLALSVLLCACSLFNIATAGFTMYTSLFLLLSVALLTFDCVHYKRIKSNM